MARPKKDAPKPAGVTNLTSTKKVLAEATEIFRKVAKMREDANELAGEARQKCKDMGIDPNWLLTAIRVAKLEPEARERADESYVLAREVIGVAVQRSLFEGFDERENAEEIAAEGKARARGKLQDPPSEPYEGDNDDLAG